MIKVTNITRKVIEKRLGLTPKQEEALNSLQEALESVLKSGIGAREIAVVLQDVGPSIPGEINQWQPFAFATLYFQDELFEAFMNGDASAREEATVPPSKPLDKFKSE